MFEVLEIKGYLQESSMRERVIVYALVIAELFETITGKSTFISKTDSLSTKGFMSRSENLREFTTLNKDIIVFINICVVASVVSIVF